MNPVWFVILVLANWASSPQPFRQQFVKSDIGRTVTICLDGQKIEQTFAGRMNFRDENRRWQSFCADVRTPVREGQVYVARALSTKKFGGNIAKAGNIVAKCFKLAQTPDQCAGLQIAVWKAIEDGADEADFSTGRLQVRASQAVMAYAQQYYQAIGIPGDAAYIQSGSGQEAPPTTTGAQNQLTIFI